MREIPSNGWLLHRTFFTVPALSFRKKKSALWCRSNCVIAVLVIGNPTGSMLSLQSVQNTEEVCFRRLREGMLHREEGRLFRRRVDYLMDWLCHCALSHFGMTNHWNERLVWDPVVVSVLFAAVRICICQQRRVCFITSRDSKSVEKKSVCVSFLHVPSFFRKC